MNDAASSNQHWRFSIAALLFVTLCVAGALTGYRLGWQAGYAGGQNKKKSEALLTKVYDVKDIVLPADPGAAAPTPDFDSLIDTLTSTVAIESWVDVGGPGNLKVMPGSLSLVIHQTGEVHEQIQDVLEQLRAAQMRAHRGAGGQTKVAE
ncbi:MAG: hypothetical protein L0211_19475 [Planctomycetaceae bacterium]|nr:hypothetical protein [Planctomycetaceae bacterium]